MYRCWVNALIVANWIPYEFMVKLEENLDADVLRNTNDLLESDDNCHLSVDKKNFPRRYADIAISLSFGRPAVLGVRSSWLRETVVATGETNLVG